jgi:hypothetical protein
MSSKGLVTQTEASGQLEAVQEQLEELSYCSLNEHPGRMNAKDKQAFLEEMSGSP